MRLQNIFSGAYFTSGNRGERYTRQPPRSAARSTTGGVGCKELWEAAARIWLPFALEERWLENGRASAATRGLFVAAIPWNWWYRYIPNLSLCLLSTKVHMAAPATPAVGDARGRTFFKLFFPLCFFHTLPPPAPNSVSGATYSSDRDTNRDRNCTSICFPTKAVFHDFYLNKRFLLSVQWTNDVTHHNPHCPRKWRRLLPSPTRVLFHSLQPGFSAVTFKKARRWRFLPSLDI